MGTDTGSCTPGRLRLLADACACLDGGRSLEDGLASVAALVRTGLAGACTITIAPVGAAPRVLRAAGEGAGEAPAARRDAGAHLGDADGHDLVVPLMAAGERVGALALGRAPGDAPLAAEDRVLIELLARQVAQAVAADAVAAQAREARAVLTALVDRAPLAVAVLDRDLRCRQVNAAMAALDGLPAEAHAGRRLDELVDHLPDHVLAELEWVRDTGEAIVDKHESLPLRADGAVRELLATYLPIATPDGPVIGVGVIVQDITARRRHERDRERMLVAERAARLELEAGHRRATLLAEIGAVFQAERDIAAALAVVGELLVRERVADVVAIDVLEAGGRLRRLAAAAHDPTEAQAARDAMPRSRVGLDDPGHPIAVAARERRRVVSAIDDRWLQRPARDDAHLDALRRMDVGVCEPLVAGDEVVGVLSLGFGATSRANAEDLDLLADVAGRLGLAVAHARSFDERARVIDQLQSALVPPRLPLVPGIELAWRHVAATEGLDVGGDFFDVFPSGDGAGDVWTVVVGDVCGKGADAAVMTAMARHTVRALAADRTDPADLLVRTNRALLREGGGELRFVTMVVGRLVPRRGGARLDLACAGHPPPLLVRADGGAGVIAVRGPLLGVREDPVYLTRGVDLGADDLLVLYTDGLTDVRGAGTSPEQLAAMAGRAARRGPDAVAAALQAHAMRGGRLADDLALLVIRARRSAR